VYTDPEIYNAERFRHTDRETYDRRQDYANSGSYTVFQYDRLIRCPFVACRLDYAQILTIFSMGQAERDRPRPPLKSAFCHPVVECTEHVSSEVPSFTRS